ncbi:hypothetical protein TNIN_169611 [Trichonephila inaurata madagascariensis]|uniref:Uncharacterized protein n=1 Tax=Trichonephila inaurata madagascariensis TaxID=2747483 RepID=A0A8X6WSG3_9ARAC|nr:hypothetical protein TNIN_169611 [Trichonephila inaurata madagascariensis]
MIYLIGGASNKASPISSQLKQTERDIERTKMASLANLLHHGTKMDQRRKERTFIKITSTPPHLLLKQYYPSKMEEESQASAQTDIQMYFWPYVTAALG